MNYRNPKFVAENTIDCELDHPEYGWIPFTCDPDDTGAMFDVKELFNRMKDEAEPFVPPTPEEIEAAKAREVRAERNNKLQTEVDPIVSNPLRWASFTAEQQQAWIDYREALLNIPEQAGFPFDVIWPERP